MLRMTQSQLLQTYKGKDNAVNLDRALRRAAAFGPPEHVSSLLELGASVTAQSEDGKTALHWAVIHGKLENIDLLRKKGANLYMPDKAKKSPADYALESVNEKIREYGYNTQNALFQNDILTKILPFLSVNELHAFRYVSMMPANASKNQEQYYLNRLNAADQTTLEKMLVPLRKVVAKRLYKEVFDPRILFLFSVLKLKISERKAIIARELKIDFPATISSNDNMFDDSGVVLIIFGILNYQQIAADRRVLNPYAVQLFDEQLLTFENIKLFNYSSGGARNNLAELFTTNGVKALRKGLISVEDAPYCADLQGMTSPEGLTLIEKKLIGIKLIKKMCQQNSFHFQMKKITQPGVVTLLEENIVSFASLQPDDANDVQRAVKMFNRIDSLAKPSSKLLLKEKQVSLDKLLNYNDIESIASDYCLQAVNDDLISAEDLFTIPDLKNLLTKNGIIALREGLLLSQQAKEIYHLGYLLTDMGLITLREGSLTIPEVILYCKTNKASGGHLKALLTEHGVKLLRQNYLAFNQITCIPMAHFEKVVSRDFIEILETGNIQFTSWTPQEINDFFQFLYKVNLSTTKTFIIELLKQGFAPQELAKIPNIELYLNQSGWIIIRDRLIPDLQLKKIKDVTSLATETGLAALKEGLINNQDDVEMETLVFLTSPGFLQLMRDDIVFVKDIKLFIASHKTLSGRYFKLICNEVCLNALRNKIFTLEQLAKIPDINIITSTEGIKAFLEGVITAEEAMKHKSLAILKIPNAITALKDKLITYDQADKFHDYGGSFQATSLKVLLTEIGLQALREKLITPEIAAMFYHSGSCTGNHDNLNVLLNKIGMIALREKLINPSDATFIIQLDDLLREDNPNIITAMELGLIKPDDFKYGKKYSFGGGGRPADFKKFTTDLIAAHKAKLIVSDERASIETKTSSACVIQKHWRGYLQRNCFKLFHELSVIINTEQANIQNIHQLSDAKKLIDGGKLVAARAKMSEIQKKSPISKNNGFLAKQKRREECAKAAENRIKKP